MGRLLTDQDVVDLTDVGELVDALEGAFLEEAKGGVTMPPRTNVPMDGGLLRLMPVALNTSGVFGFKEFHTTGNAVHYLVAVFDLRSGTLLGLVDGHELTALRTGATAGVAARHLARDDARSVAVIGSGVEARTNLAAMVAVRPIEDVRVYSPRASRREEFAADVASTHGIHASTHNDPELCVDGADIVVVATNTSRAPDPIAFRGDWVQPGMHVSSIGSTLPSLRELDTATFARADHVVVDAGEQLRDESGDVIAALAAGTYPEPRSLAAVVAGNLSRADGAVTLFKSVGTAVQDVVAAHLLLGKAAKVGRGVPVDGFPVRREF